MKPRALSYFPRTLMVCMAPLLVCGSARATIVKANDSNGSGVWTFPAGTNLLTSPSPSTVVSHEGSDANWSRVIDGSLGDTGGSPATSCTPNNGNVVTFPLDLTGHPGGRDITSFDSYCTWGNSGRDNQNYTLQYSTVADPTTFINITAVNNGTGSDRSTHTRITNDAGFLATGVHSVRVIFGAFNGSQENGYVGYREFIVTDTPAVVSVATEATNNNAFFLPAGGNLLTGVTPVETPATHEGSSGTWATTIDGSVGDYTTPTTSVTPNDNNTVTFPLDLSGAHSDGYNITSFDSYAAWGSNGRDDQHYTLSYSTVSAPSTFIPITNVAVHTEFNVAPRQATHARVTANGGVMASNVAAIRLTFSGQENGYEGYREFVLQDIAHNNIATESNNTNSWTLPVGTNLLSSATSYNPGNPANSNHGNGDITGGTWNILTDGTVGSAGNQSQSVAPLEDASVVYTLDTTTNVNGYNLTAFDSYAAWGDSGRDDQSFSVFYSTVADPSTFIPIGRIENHTNSGFNATHSRITPPSGFLATNVGAVKFFFKNQENGYIGYREFVASGSAVSLANPLTWSGLSGNGSWVTTADNNWKSGPSSANFTSLAPLTFDSTGTFTTINIPTALTASSLTFSNGNTVPYVFNGAQLTVTNDVTLAGAGTAKFDNSIQAAGLTVSGTGSLTLSTDNTLTGSSVVNNGVLNLSSDGSLGASPLSLTGGTVNFTSGSPVVNSLGGTGGSVYLGNSVSSGATQLFVGDSTSSAYAGSIADASGSAIGSLTKNGSGTLTLNGTNTYSGATIINDGELHFGKRVSLYNGNTVSWTASNIVVYGTLGLSMGGVGEFTSADLAALNTGGFDTNSTLSIDTTSGNTDVTDAFGGAMKIEKQGGNTLKLSTTNTFSNGITVDQGAIEAANPGGISIPSDLTVGNVTFDAWANMGFSNQFGPTSLLRFNTGPGAVNGKVNLRGTSQTVAGLESASGNRIAIVQNDETSAPGYTTNPGPCSITIDTAPSTFHSFKGIIRNQDGASLSLTKTGTGTQELVNSQVQGNSYNGATNVNEGTLRINFSGGNTGFGSDITVASGATLNFHAAGGNYAFDRVIGGDGNVVVDGSNAVIFTNNQNTFTNGVTVGVNTFDGFLALSGNGAAGAGNGPGQFCAGGAMIPTNVITVNGGAILSLDGIAPLGNSSVLPAFAPSVRINENSKLFGGTNTVAFVSNITLDGGTIEITNGATHGDFNTDLTFVGKVVVPAGSSTVPSLIHTTGTGPNANASLGSAAVPGTEFQVADVTGSSAADLTVSSVLKDISPSGFASPSPLVKSGPGTLSLEGANTYTGDTTVTGGELTVNGAAIVDTNKLVLDGGKLGLSADETVGTLYFGAAQQLAGTYGSTSSSATYKDDTRFAGTGVLTVTTGPITDPYELWSAVIPNASYRGRTDDPDGDGLTNLQEYLFGTSPIANNGSLYTMVSNGSNLTIRWSERASGTYVLQESTTLLDNPWPTSGVTPTVDPDQTGLYSGDYTRKQAVIPINSASKFVRVQASE